MLEALAAAITVLGFVFASFAALDTIVRPSVRARCAKWLRDLEVPAQIRRWPSLVAATLDSLLDPRVLSLRNFAVSSALSTTSVVATFLIFGLLRPCEMRAVIQQFSVSQSLVALLLLCAALNWIPDYVSLLETRFVLSKLNEASQEKLAIRWVLVDLALSAMIFMLFFVLLVATLSVLVDGPSAATRSFAGNFSTDRLLTLVTLGAHRDDSFLPVVLGLFFYATFATSLWIWIYVTAAVLISGISRLSIRWKLVNSKLIDLRKRPFTMLGIAATLLVACLLTAIAALGATYRMVADRQCPPHFKAGRCPVIVASIRSEDFASHSWDERDFLGAAEALAAQITPLGDDKCTAQVLFTSLDAQSCDECSLSERDELRHHAASRLLALSGATNVVWVDPRVDDGERARIHVTTAAPVGISSLDLPPLTSLQAIAAARLALATRAFVIRRPSTSFTSTAASDLSKIAHLESRDPAAATWTSAERSALALIEARAAEMLALGAEDTEREMLDPFDLRIRRLEFAVTRYRDVISNPTAQAWTDYRDEATYGFKRARALMSMMVGQPGRFERDLASLTSVEIANLQPTASAILSKLPSDIAAFQLFEIEAARLRGREFGRTTYRRDWLPWREASIERERLRLRRSGVDRLPNSLYGLVLRPGGRMDLALSLALVANLEGNSERAYEALAIVEPTIRSRFMRWWFGRSRLVVAGDVFAALANTTGSAEWICRALSMWVDDWERDGSKVAASEIDRWRAELAKATIFDPQQRSACRATIEQGLKNFDRTRSSD